MPPPHRKARRGRRERRTGGGSASLSPFLVPPYVFCVLGALFSRRGQHGICYSTVQYSSEGAGFAAFVDIGICLC